MDPRENLSSAKLSEYWMQNFHKYDLPYHNVLTVNIQSFYPQPSLLRDNNKLAIYMPTLIDKNNQIVIKIKNFKNTKDVTFS